MSRRGATLAPVLELLAELTADRLPGETPAQRRARRDAAADIATDMATDMTAELDADTRREVGRMVRLLAGHITPGMDIHLDGRWLRVTEVRRDGDVVDLTAGRLRAALQSSHIVAARELADRR